MNTQAFAALRNAKITTFGGYTNVEKHEHRSYVYTTLDYIENVLNIRSYQEFHNLSRRISRDLGYNLFGLGMLIKHHEDWQGYVGYDQQGSWIDLYLSKLLYQDPLADRMLAQINPLIWNYNSHDEAIRSSKVMYEALRDYEFKNIVCVPCHSIYGGIGGMRYSNYGQPALTTSDIENGIPLLITLTYYLFEIVSMMIDKDINRSISLTRRECQVLQWAAKSKTSWEISEILKISENTVLTYFKRAFTKLGVSTRQHAIAKAVSLRLIEF